MTQSQSERRAGTTEGQPSAPKQIFRNEHFTVLVDERLRIVRTVRTSKPFTSMAELEVIFTELGQVLDALGRSQYALLSDVRAAPGRNDPLFESTLQRFRPRWLGGFRKVGVLVQTVVGMLQVQRYAKQDTIPRLVTNNEDEILKYFAQEE